MNNSRKGRRRAAPGGEHLPRAKPGAETSEHSRGGARSATTGGATRRPAPPRGEEPRQPSAAGGNRAKSGPGPQAAHQAAHGGAHGGRSGPRTPRPGGSGAPRQRAASAKPPMAAPCAKKPGAARAGTASAGQAAHNFKPEAALRHRASGATTPALPGAERRQVQASQHESGPYRASDKLVSGYFGAFGYRVDLLYFVARHSGADGHRCASVRFFRGNSSFIAGGLRRHIRRIYPCTFQAPWRPRPN